jgi:hypothetical protein
MRREIGGVVSEVEGSTLSGLTGRTIVRRRRLAGVVFMAIAGCGAILVAAAFARLSRSKEAAAATSSAMAAEAPPSTTNAASAATEPPAAPPMSTSTMATTAAAPDPATGTVVLGKATARGPVWLDGKRLSAASTVVACGSHQVKVGFSGRAHALAVPCGGTLKVGH